MAISKESFDNALNSTKTTISYNGVDNASSQVQETFDVVKSTEVGKETNQVIGGVKSVTSKTDIIGAENFTPTEGVLTSGALDGSINPALNTDISSLSSEIGVGVSITYNDSGRNTGISYAKKESGSLSSILSGITGLGVAPGYLQNMVSNANSKGLNTSINSVAGNVGAFSSIGAVNSLSSRTQSIIDDVVNNAVTDGKTGSTDRLTAFQNEGSDAITDVANTVVTAISPNVGGVLGAVTGRKGEDVIKEVRNYKNIRSGVVNERNKFISSLERSFPIGQLGFAQNLVRKLDTNSLDNVFVANKIITTEEDRDEIIRLSQGTQVQKAEARRILQKKYNKTPKEAIDLLNALDSTIAGSIIVDNSNSVFDDPFDIKGQTPWNNGVGAENFTFSFISSLEELDAEFRSIIREVTEMVVHWTETYSNSNIGSEEINKTQISLGLKGIGYHYVIRRDGSVQRGRPVNIQGEHVEVNGHNERSIGVVFVGGINAPTGTPNPLEYKSSSSLTRSQFTSFQEICKAFYRTFPGGQILGHNDLNSLEDDPGFDVRDFCEDVFGKKSLFSDPSSQSPFTSKEINESKIL